MGRRRDRLAGARRPLGACLIGIPVGLALGLSPLAERLSRGLVDVLRSLPGTALIPVFMITIGTGDLMKVILVVFVGVWPILFNTMYGIASVDKVAIESALSCRVTGPALWRRVMLPSAAPFIATGIRYALPIAIVIVIADELVVGSPEGIGGYPAAAADEHRLAAGGDLRACCWRPASSASLLNLVMDAAVRPLSSAGTCGGASRHERRRARRLGQAPILRARPDIATTGCGRARARAPGARPTPCASSPAS